MIEQFLTSVIVSFLDGRLETGNCICSSLWTEQLILFLQDFAIISTSYSEYTVVNNATLIIHWFDSTLQT